MDSGWKGSVLGREMKEEGGRIVVGWLECDSVVKGGKEGDGGGEATAGAHCSTSACSSESRNPFSLPSTTCFLPKSELSNEVSK